MKNQTKLILAVTLLGPLLSIIPVGFKVYSILNSPYAGVEKRFEIKKGEGFSSINYRLHKNGYIKSSRVFHYYSKYYDRLTAYKSGTYPIKKGMSLIEISQMFVDGKGIIISVTIPEGKNIYEVAEILAGKGVSNKKSLIKLMKNKSFTDDHGIPAEIVEGYLYPNTYMFSPDLDAKEVLTMMIKEFWKKTSALDYAHSELTPHQVIILASIVEKETGAGFERPIIAGVFHNRLKKRMRLQSDPTTIYGIYENFDGNLRKRDLLKKTPYNTYKISGLPKGPIANPGIDAIEAVLKPEKHNFLYFVSYNDGTHKFSKTYKEHLKAVDKYQIKRRHRKGKSWRQLDMKHRKRKK
ncbi:MAG: endolytic transglycosylase MltG [Bacteriovoracaceae bacterium]|jgi:UPF0755 protein|nr:endolytic transglycosylase MltG [Bacteriovoracaceae bacterium]